MLEATLFPLLRIASRLGAALSFAVFVLSAARDAEAYRPFDGTDADIAEVGEFELELGPAHYYRQGTNRYLITPATVLNLGFTRNLELVADFKQFAGLQRVQGESRVRVLDTDVLLKWILRRGALQEETGPSVALEGGPLLPEIQGENHFGAQADLIVSSRFAAAMMHFNEQVALTRLGNLDLFSSVIIEGPHEWPVRPVAEVFSEHEFGVGPTYSGLVGAIWAVHKSFEVDFGLRAAKIDDQRATEIRLGFTWALPVGSTAPKTSGDNGPRLSGERGARWRTRKAAGVASTPSP